MITEAQYIAYFTNLAAQHTALQHGTGGDAFFYIPVSYDLDEIDKAIRNTAKNPMLALDSLKGRFDDGGAESHTQYIDGQFMILDKASIGESESLRTVQDNCLQIGLQILARMQNDSKRNPFTDGSGRRVNFYIRNVQYQPVGPMEQQYYGYAFTFSMTCPFGFSVTNAIWLDKT